MKTNCHVIVGPGGWLKAFELISEGQGVGLECEWCADAKDAYWFVKRHEAQALLDENHSLRGCWLDSRHIELDEKLIASKIKEHDATQWTGIKDQIRTFLKEKYWLDLQELRSVFKVRNEIRRQMEKLEMEVIFTEKKNAEEKPAVEETVENPCVEVDDCSCNSSDGCDDCPLDVEEDTEVAIDRRTIRLNKEEHPGLWNLGFRSALVVDGHIEEAYKEEKIPDFKITKILTSDRGEIEYIELPTKYYSIESDEDIIAIVHDKEVADKYAEIHGYEVVEHDALTEEDF